MRAAAGAPMRGMVQRRVTRPPQIVVRGNRDDRLRKHPTYPPEHLVLEGLRAALRRRGATSTHQQAPRRHSGGQWRRRHS